VAKLVLQVARPHHHPLALAPAPVHVPVVVVVVAEMVKLSI